MVKGITVVLFQLIRKAGTKDLRISCAEVEGLSDVYRPGLGTAGFLWGFLSHLDSGFQELAAYWT